MFGNLGVILVSLILVAVMAASMSTADSNLHALSAVATRDVYDQMRPKSSHSERAWIGRLVINVATLAAASITYLGTGTDLLNAIAAFFLLAMAFSAQLLPITIDLLFLRRGTKAGAAAGLIAGILTVCLFPPLGTLIFGAENMVIGGTTKLKTILDVGFCGIAINTLVFAAVSRFTPPPDQSHRESFARDLRG